MLHRLFFLFSICSLVCFTAPASAQITLDITDAVATPPLAPNFPSAQNFYVDINLINTGVSRDLISYAIGINFSPTIPNGRIQLLSLTNNYLTGAQTTGTIPAAPAFVTTDVQAQSGYTGGGGFNTVAAGTIGTPTVITLARLNFSLAANSPPASFDMIASYAEVGYKTPTGSTAIEPSVASGTISVPEPSFIFLSPLTIFAARRRYASR